MNQPIRVLHVLGQLEHGGVSSWVKCLMASVPREKLAIDICCDYRQTTGVLTKEFETLGAKVHWVPLSWNLYKYQSQLSKIIVDGCYSIVHAHRSFNSGASLRAAAKAGVAVRIAYHHTPNDNVVRTAGRMLYSAILQRWTMKYATHIWGCSHAAMNALYGSKWQNKNHRFAVVYGAVPCLHAVPDARMSIRAEFGIAATAFVVGFIGRITPPKNPLGAMQICIELLGQDPDIHCLFVGDGPQMKELQEMRISCQYAARIHLAGFRNDIANILQSIDVFLQPSEFEGLPLSTLEALDAGLPVVGSRAPGLIEALPKEYHALCSDPRDIKAFIRNIRIIKESKQHYLRPDAWLARFSRESFAAAIVNRYSEALGGKTK